jgi:hypothetical protein
VDKEVLPYSFVILKSDLIVEGRIAQLSETSFIFQIDSTIKGSNIDTCRVLKWGQWTCDHRIKDYVVGQHLILFMILDDNQSYTIINGSTGELFIEEDLSIRTFTYGNSLPQRDEVITGINMVLSAVDYEGPLYPTRTEKGCFSRLVSENEFNRMMEENDFFKQAVRHIDFNRRRYTPEPEPKPYLAPAPISPTINNSVFYDGYKNTIHNYYPAFSNKVKLVHQKYYYSSYSNGQPVPGKRIYQPYNNNKQREQEIKVSNHHNSWTIFVFVL